MTFTTNGQQIPCPVCKTGIPFDTRQLLQGVQFSCPSCQASIGLADESKEVVRQAMESFEKTRQGLQAAKTGNSLP